VKVSIDNWMVRDRKMIGKGRTNWSGGGRRLHVEV